MLLAQSALFQFRRDQTQQQARQAALSMGPAVTAGTTVTVHDGAPVLSTTVVVQVKASDYIYQRNGWDSAPIVLEEHRLVFFSVAKVGCTQFKMLFRRMMGYQDWNVEEYERFLPWNPNTNGLKYLYHYSLERATEMMTSPEWTRAIFVRDPKERFLSAYLDKVVNHPFYFRNKCCPDTGDCVEKARQSFQVFVSIAKVCEDEHWKPQGHRMEARFWPFVNFVGHMETINEDIERLLKQIGAWENFGRTGWGENGDEAIFAAKSGGTGRHHATNARQKLRQFMTPDLEVQVDEFLADDYKIEQLGLVKSEIFGHDD